jgi:plasmid maintenance system antidote protein VapI
LAYCPIMQRDLFRLKLIERLKRDNIEVTQLAEATGIPKDKIYSIKRRENASTSVETAIGIARYFGETIEQFLGLEAKNDAMQQFNHLASLLTDQERILLTESIKAFVAQRDQAQKEPSPSEQSI